MVFSLLVSLTPAMVWGQPPLTDGLITWLWPKIKIFLPLSVLCFAGLFFLVFLYLRSFVQAGSFLIQLFSPSEFSAKGGKTPLTVPKIRTKKRLSALFYLSHTRNSYLKHIRSSLNTVLNSTLKKKESAGDEPAVLSFSDLIDKAILKSQGTYPDLKIQTELKADINLPVFGSALFQALWELLKNAELVNPADEAITIKTYEKGSNWFCCEVEDKGPGMNRALMEKASRLYWTTKEKATGLGLPLVQKVLSSYGWIYKTTVPSRGRA